jgi:hypothetical protein
MVPVSASTITYANSVSGSDYSYENFASSETVNGNEIYYIDFPGNVSYKIVASATHNGWPDSGVAYFRLQNVNTSAIYNIAQRSSAGTTQTVVYRDNIPDGYYRVQLYIYSREQGDDTCGISATISQVSIEDSYQPEPEPESEYIYFDDSTYNFTDTVYIHYDRCYDPDEDGELDLGWRWGGLLESFIYAEDYLYVNVNAGEDYNGSWTTYRNVYGKKLNYLDLGNCWQSDHFLLGSDLPGWHLNATLEKRTDLYYGVYGVYGIYRGTYIEVLDSDLAYVSSIENTNITEPDYVVDVPDIPGYESNYTPPQPVEGTNDTLGTSFLGGYYQTVDSIIQPMNDTVSGVFSFAVSPVTVLGDSVLGMTVYLNSSLDTALYYVSPVSVILDAVFYAIPDKVEFLFQLSLILIGVLVVLRWR